MIRFDNLKPGAQVLTPYLCVKDAHAMIEFYKKAFGARAENVSLIPDTNSVMHAEVWIGDMVFFINDEFPTYNALAPVTTGHTSSSVHIQVSEGLDELYNQAVAAGAQGVMPPADQFWGDRFAMVVDPSGHKWSIGMPIENPPPMDLDAMKAMA